MVLDLFQNFSSQDNDGRSAIADFGILRACNIRQYSSGRMNYIEELHEAISFRLEEPDAGEMYLHDSRTVVCDGLPAICIYKQQISSIWSQSTSYGRLYSQTSIDV